MSKFQVRQPSFGLILTGPKRTDPKMFGGPLEEVPVGSKEWKAGPILDQLQESACVGFGWTQFLMSDPIPYPVVGFDYALGVYRRAQELDGWEGAEPEYYGTSVEAGHAVLLERKLVKETIYWAKSISQIVKHTLECGPVVMGTQWLSAMMEPDEDGYVRAVGRPVGGHCYCINSVINEGGKKEFGLVNSWGKDWGVDGTFKMRFRDMDRLLKLQGYGISAMEEAA